MLLIALLLFCKVIDNMDLKNLHDGGELHNKIMDDLLHEEENMKQGKISEANTATSTSSPSSDSSGNLPPLVAFEFPPDFYEKQGRKIVEAFEGKVGKFFGTSQVNKLKTFDNAEGMFDYLSNMDFNNCIVNYIVQKCIAYVKPTETVQINGIKKNACRQTCQQTLSTPIAFVHRMFQSFISQVTDEDLRFQIYQDPEKSYEYSFDRRKKQRLCKCVDKGFQVKVSPRLLEIINSKFNDPRGLDLVEELNKDTPLEELTNVGSYFGLKKMANLALYFSGFSSSSKSRMWGGGGSYYGNSNYYRKDPVDFITGHLLLNIFLFIFCHCLWYFHIVYFVLVFIAEYILR